MSCPIARLGYDRDGKKGKLQINYGLLTNERGIPVSVSVFEGNTGDPKTLLPQVEKVQERFGIEQFVMVGDRGMITQTQIDELREMDGVDWITALRPEPIRKLINDGVLQMGLFDERNLFEVTHPDFPNERLVACRNPELAERRRHKRRALLEATCKELEKVCRMVERRRLQGKEDIRAAVKKLLNKYKVGRYYRLDIRDDGFDFELDETTMDADASRLANGNSENILGKAPKEIHDELKAEILESFTCEELRARAEEGPGGDYPVPSTDSGECDERHGKETLEAVSGQVLRLPEAHHKRLRTSNLLEQAPSENSTRRDESHSSLLYRAGRRYKLSFAVLLATASKWRGVRMDVFTIRRIEELRNEFLPKSTSEEPAA